jgi:ERCC4-related helicase
LKQTLRPGGKWNEERVILFTEYRATQKWLFDLLAREGFVADGRLEMIYGGMPNDQREPIKAATPETRLCASCWQQTLLPKA